MTVREIDVRFTHRNSLGNTISQIFPIKDMDIQFNVEGAELKRTITNRLIPRKTLGYRMRVSFDYEIDIYGSSFIQFLNDAKADAATGNSALAIQFRTTNAQGWEDAISIVLEQSSGYEMSYDGQVLSSSRPRLTFLSKDLINIPTYFSVFNASI